MAYRLIFGKQDYTSDGYEVSLETSEGHRGHLVDPSWGGGPLPAKIKERLPTEFIIKSGETTREFSACATQGFTVTETVKTALEPFASRFEYFPLDVVDIPKGTEQRNGLWLLYPPDRAQVINLAATGDALAIRQRPSEWINGKLVEFSKSYSVRDYKRLVIDKQAVEGLHLWSGVSGWLPGFWFCSEEFMRAATPFRRSFDFEFIPEE